MSRARFAEDGCRDRECGEALYLLVVSWCEKSFWKILSRETPGLCFKAAIAGQEWNRGN